MVPPRAEEIATDHERIAREALGVVARDRRSRRDPRSQGPPRELEVTRAPRVRGVPGVRDHAVRRVALPATVEGGAGLVMTAPGERRLPYRRARAEDDRAPLAVVHDEGPLDLRAEPVDERRVRRARNARRGTRWLARQLLGGGPGRRLRPGARSGRLRARSREVLPAPGRKVPPLADVGPEKAAGRRTAVPALVRMAQADALPAVPRVIRLPAADRVGDRQAAMAREADVRRDERQVERGEVRPVEPPTVEHRARAAIVADRAERALGVDGDAVDAEGVVVRQLHAREVVAVERRLEDRLELARRASRPMANAVVGLVEGGATRSRGRRRSGRARTRGRLRGGSGAARRSRCRCCRCISSPAARLR